jgi:hypothetical protein
MADNAQAEEDQSKRKLSHVLLIKLLVVEELKWLGSDWDSFFLTTGIPKDPKGDFPLLTERVISHCAKAKVERPHRRKRHWKPCPPNKIAPRRDRPKKNKEAGETRVPSEPHAKSIAEELLMHTIRLEPVEGTNQESQRRMRRTDAKSTNVHEPSQ